MIVLQFGSICLGLTGVYINKVIYSTVKVDSCGISMANRKHETVIPSVKMGSLRKLNKGEKVANIARTHNIPLTTTCSIKTTREKIEKFVEDAEGGFSLKHPVKADNFCSTDV